MAILSLVCLVTGRLQAKVTEVVDPTTFLQDGVPYQWRYSDLYRGWNLVWLAGGPSTMLRAAQSLSRGGKPASLCTIASYDPDTTRFTLAPNQLVGSGLAQPHGMKPGDRFEVFPPGPTNWNIHDNTITACTRPVVLDSYGSETAILKGNIISHGEATGVQSAVEIHGRFQLIGNHISGFDEKNSTALALHPDPLGRACRNLYRRNIFERCANVVSESVKGLWQPSDSADNIFLDCAGSPVKDK